MRRAAAARCGAPSLFGTNRRAADAGRAADLVTRWSIARVLVIALLAAAALAHAPSAGAQTETNGDAPEGGFETLAASAVLIVDIERIYRESSAGRSIADAEAALVARTEAELSERRAALQAESEALTEGRGVIPQDEFRTREEAFRSAVAALRQFRRDRARAIQRAAAEARNDLKRALEPVLVAIMRERRAGVMLDARVVILSASALDITDEAIKRLDEQTPSIEVRIDETEGE